MNTITRIFANLPYLLKKGKRIGSLPYTEAVTVADAEIINTANQTLAERVLAIQRTSTELLDIAMRLELDAAQLEQHPSQQQEIADQMTEQTAAYYEQVGTLLAKLYGEVKRISLATGKPYGITLANAHSYYMHTHTDQNNK